MIIFVIMASLMNYQYTRFENYKKCISEKTESSFCEEKIKENKKSKEALGSAEISESSMGG